MPSIFVAAPITTPSASNPVQTTTDSTIPMGKNNRPLIRAKDDVQSILRIPRHPNRISPPFHRRGTVSRHLTLESAELSKIEPSPEPAMQRHPQKKLSQNLRGCHGACSTWRESDTWTQHYFETRTRLLMSETIRESLAAHEKKNWAPPTAKQKIERQPTTCSCTPVNEHHRNPSASRFARSASVTLHEIRHVASSSGPSTLKLIFRDKQCHGACHGRVHP